MPHIKQGTKFIPVLYAAHAASSTIFNAQKLSSLPKGYRVHRLWLESKLLYTTPADTGAMARPDGFLECIANMDLVLGKIIQMRGITGRILAHINRVDPPNGYNFHNLLPEGGAHLGANTSGTKYGVACLLSDESGQATMGHCYGWPSELLRQATFTLTTGALTAFPDGSTLTSVTGEWWVVAEVSPATRLVLPPPVEWRFYPAVTAARSFVANPRIRILATYINSELASESYTADQKDKLEVDGNEWTPSHALFYNQHLSAVQKASASEGIGLNDNDVGMGEAAIYMPGLTDTCYDRNDYRIYLPGRGDLGEDPKPASEYVFTPAASRNLLVKTYEEWTTEVLDRYATEMNTEITSGTFIGPSPTERIPFAKAPRSVMPLDTGLLAG